MRTCHLIIEHRGGCDSGADALESESSESQGEEIDEEEEQIGCNSSDSDVAGDSDALSNLIC